MDLLDEDADLRDDLTELGPDFLRDLREVLDRPQEERDEVSRLLIARPEAQELAMLLAMAGDDPTIRLRLLQIETPCHDPADEYAPRSDESANHEIRHGPSLGDRNVGHNSASRVAPNVAPTRSADRGG